MCGIVGVLDWSGEHPPDVGLLRQMLGIIRHRGPDEFGLYVDHQVGIGCARLSIVDLSTGQQPIPNEDESLWIVFNGGGGGLLTLQSTGDGMRFNGAVTLNTDVRIDTDSTDSDGEGGDVTFTQSATIDSQGGMGPSTGANELVMDAGTARVL